MKRKTFIITAVVFLLGGIGTLQAFTALEKEEPQEIRGIVVEDHDSLWYETQQQLWLQKAATNPTDEHAWKQAFEAARYADMNIEDWGRTERKQAILDKMNEYIPNSFAYNLCMYMTEICEREGDPELYAEKALQLMPENIVRKDAEMLISYLWMSGKTFAKGRKPNTEQQQLMKFAQKLYATNAYPSYLLRYTYNSLQGMDENAIYFVNGDVNYIVMLAPVVKSYKEEGDTLHANQLARYLTTAVVQTSLSDEEKVKYINLLGDKKK